MACVPTLAWQPHRLRQDEPVGFVRRPFLLRCGLAVLIPLGCVLGLAAVRALAHRPSKYKHWTTLRGSSAGLTVEHGFGTQPWFWDAFGLELVALFFGSSVRAIGPSEVAIVPPRALRFIGGQGFDPAVTWEPSWNLVERCEDRLRAEFRRRLSSDLVPAQRKTLTTARKAMDGSRRQYLGESVDGRRVLYLTSFPAEVGDDPPRGWQVGVMSICDGGAAFWQARWWLDSDVVEILPNGEA